MTYVVEEVVGTGKLLQRLENHSQNDSVEHAGSSDELVPDLLSGLGIQLLLDLLQLLVDQTVVLGDTVHLGHGGTGIVDTAMAVVITRTLGEEQHTTTEDEGEQERETQGDTPLGGALHGVGSQVDAVRQEDTQGDEELVGANHGTTDLTRSTLSLVHGDDQGAATNTKTRDPTTHGHLDPVSGRRGNLHNETNDHNETPEGDRPLAAKLVGDRSSAKSTNQGTNGKQTDNQTGADRAERVFTIGILLTIAMKVVGHFLETRDLTSVVTEEKTTHGDEGSHHKGPKGDPRNGSVYTHLRRLVHGDRFLAGLLLGSTSRADRLPMVGRRFMTHLEERLLYVGRRSCEIERFGSEGYHKINNN